MTSQKIKKHNVLFLVSSLKDMLVILLQKSIDKNKDQSDWMQF